MAVKEPDILFRIEGEYDTLTRAHLRAVLARHGARRLRCNRYFVPPEQREQLVLALAGIDVRVHIEDEEGHHNFYEDHGEPVG
jgi:hypothetical protein